MEKKCIFDWVFLFKPQNKITTKVGTQSDVVVTKETVNDGRRYIRRI